MSPNPQCTFDLNGVSYDQDDGAYPSCPSDYVAFGEPGAGFCCQGHCQFSQDVYIYNITDIICAAKGNANPVLYGETFSQCADPDPTNKFCMWSVGPAWDVNEVQGWQDYTIRAEMAF